MIRAALSILACLALEAHYRRNLARVVPQPEPLPELAPEPRPLDPHVVTVRIGMRVDQIMATKAYRKDFALWQAERERDVAAGESA